MATHDDNSEDKSGVPGLVEKVIKELNHYLADRRLTEFDIVPEESTTNRSPVLHVETSLGLESWCVKHVYNYCYTELMRDYLTNPKRRLSRLSNLNYKRIYALLNPTLLINPDVTSLWNKRREMALRKFHDWRREMHFSKLVLSRKPKCNEAYAYRRWIFSTLLKDQIRHFSQQFLADTITEELRICTVAADRCINNYHSWQHRAFVMEMVRQYKDNLNSTRVFFNEYRFIHKWTAEHVSDYSCFHYRQTLVKILFYIDEQWAIFETNMEVNLRENLQKILADHLTTEPTVTPNMISKKAIDGDYLTVLILGFAPGDCKCYAEVNKTLRRLELLFYEMVVNEDLLKYYTNHQSIWYHRRFIVNSILTTMYSYLEIMNNLDGSLKSKVEPRKRCKKCFPLDMREHHNNVFIQGDDWFWKCPLYKALIRHEIALINDRRKDDLKYAEAHENYLKFFEGLFVNFEP